MTNNESSPAQPISNLRLTIPDSYPSQEEALSTVLYGKGQHWAVLVGINTYEDHNYYGTLSVSVHDAEAIHATLLHSNDFDSQHIHLLTDQEPRLPSRGLILSTLQSVALATEPDDLLLFYFSGHGEEHNGESYLVPRDGRHLVLTDTGIPMKRVTEILNSAKARAKVIILDACHAGAKIGSKGAQPMSAKFIYHTFEQAAGIAIIASCLQGQLSYEWSEKQCSTFTYYLLEALEGLADRDEKGFVTVQDINRHIIPNVRLWASQHQLNQTPKLNYDVIGDIILTHYTKQDRIQYTPNPPTQNTSITHKSKITDTIFTIEKPISILDDNINDYIGDINALREGRVHQELTDRLAATGAIKPGPAKQEPEDILERYRSIPLHALFLYTSEDTEVHTYALDHWKAVDALSANNCDVYPILAQFDNNEDAYDFIGSIDAVKRSKVRPTYSQLPGIFFWDNHGDSAYISFGSQADLTTIRNILRVTFDQIRDEPTIAAVRRASRLLMGKSEMDDDKPLPSPKPTNDDKLPLSQQAGTRTTAFIAYDPQDKKYRKELRTHLTYYEQQRSIQVWDDTMIMPGKRRVDEINTAIQSAKVVILLLSPDFLISDFMKSQIPQLLQAAERNEVVILPVIVRSCPFEDTPLASFEPVNSPELPLSSIKSARGRDATWVKVTKLVKDLLATQN